MSLSRNAENVPLDVQVVLGQVHAVGHRVVALNRVDVDQVHLQSIISLEMKSERLGNNGQSTNFIN